MTDDEQWDDDELESDPEWATEQARKAREEVETFFAMLAGPARRMDEEPALSKIAHEAAEAYRAWCELSVMSSWDRVEGLSVSEQWQAVRRRVWKRIFRVAASRVPTLSHSPAL
jgi:hypothetical protein